MLHQHRVVILVGGVLLGALLGLGLIFGSTLLIDQADHDLPAARVAENDSGSSDPDIAQSTAAHPTSTMAPAPIVGAPAPDFELEDPQGEIYRLREQRGGVVLLNFWATWCGPCRVEMPALQDKYEQWREAGFTILGVNFDENAADVREFKEELGLGFPLLLDPGGRVQSLYNIRGYPSTVIVDAQGVIRIIHIGIITEGQLQDYLAQVGLQS
jgi:peroxiredoxin